MFCSFFLCLIYEEFLGLLIIPIKYVYRIYILKWILFFFQFSVHSVVTWWIHVHSSHTSKSINHTKKKGSKKIERNKRSVIANLYATYGARVARNKTINFSRMVNWRQKKKVCKLLKKIHAQNTLFIRSNWKSAT